ncbi:MAG: chitobiase/beta-hexosaminidase C-terminal domain-containing protein, partial [Planctomycetota bacterium]|nr:chitobiase/beta-hexosaminidase C-terminal domain-containing protein [Planctomycetota bacterium]
MRGKPPRVRHLQSVAACLSVCLAVSSAWGAVTAQYIRVENPTGFVMEVRQVEVYSGGKNVVLRHQDMVSGTVPPLKGDEHPTYQSIVVNAPREGGEITNGDTNVAHRASEWRAYVNPIDNAPGLNPWIEINLGQPMAIEKIVIYGSRYPERVYIDKGHRVVSLLDKDRKVVWADKWQYYDQKKYPKGVFEFEPAPSQAGKGSVVGMVIPPKASNWVSMGWLLDAEASQPPPDAARRQQVFAGRNSPEEIKKLAERVFPLLDERIPEIAAAKQLHAAGKCADAFDAWKKYWFAKMARVNMHAALHGDFISYDAHGDDLLNGLMVAITPGTAKAIKYTPGEIYWINLPAGKDGRELNAALDDCKAKAAVGKVSWPLLYSYRRNPDQKYIQRWAEIMDDWALNFFEDAAKTPHEVEDLFTFNPCHPWGTMMEDLSDIAKERPALADLIPATTLARVQLICLEKYSTAWWRQARETVFNHTTGGVYAWDTVLPYIDEFHPGQRARQEWRQAFERFMTMATEPDGSLTEIGDEGHQEIPVLFGFNFQRADLNKPAWYTPGWRNRAMEWYDNLHYYMFRHLAPGGYEHRFAVDYRPSRWYSTTIPYFPNHPKAPPMLNRDKEVYGNPEVRRMLDAWGHISSGIPAPSDPALKPIADTQRQSQEIVKKALGDDKPGMPHVISDWMPYTGAYYFRGSWDDDAPFIGMMACGSHGGSQAPQWPYTMFYHYDYRYPLVAAKPVLVDGQPPDYLQGRRHTFQPGTKTMALTYADEKPAKHRWLSTKNFDFGEAFFTGTYLDFPGFKNNWDYALQMAPDRPGINDVRSMRQIVQVRGSRLFIVTDALAVADKKPHNVAVPYTFSLSGRMKNQSRPFGAEQLVIDKTGRLNSDNPDGPSVTLYQFTDQPLTYQRRPEAKLDTKKYSRRLTDAIGIAEQQVSAEVKSDHLSLVSVISSRDKGAQDRIASIEAANRGSEAVGFHAKLQDGGEIWYQSAGLAAGKLTCGPGAAEGQVLLVVKDKTGVSGILLGGKSLSLDGKTVTLREPDCEFVTTAGGADIPVCRGIYMPIDPVSFKPGRNTFADSEKVEMVSATPNVELRYTTDGTRPTRTSKLYTGPVTITESTDFAARAYRLGPDG